MNNKTNTDRQRRRIERRRQKETIDDEVRYRRRARGGRCSSARRVAASDAPAAEQPRRTAPHAHRELEFSKPQLDDATNADEPSITKQPNKQQERQATTTTTTYDGDGVMNCGQIRRLLRRLLEHQQRLSFASFDEPPITCADNRSHVREVSEFAFVGRRRKTTTTRYFVELAVDNERFAEIE